MTQREPEHKNREAGQGIEPVEEMRTCSSTTVTLVPVRFRNDRPSVHCDACELSPDVGEWVVVPCEQCSEVGQVAGLPLRVEIPEDCEIPRIERLATTREIELYYQNLESEKSARRVCQERIDALGLQMKLVRVESLFDGSKIIFYYSADGRVDFRELVKDLVRALKTRVEMCQIGIRHEAKMTGGIGSCGRVLCCTSFLKSFDPVSIKMAKVQNLPLNPNKISGFCGRLLCCLTFEYDTYREYARHLPLMGNVCDSPSGEGKVVRRNILKKTVSLSTEQNGVVEFSNAELEDFRKRKELGLGSKSGGHGKSASQKVTSPGARKPQRPSPGKKKAGEGKGRSRQGKQTKKAGEAKKEIKGKKASSRKRDARSGTQRKGASGKGPGRKRGSRRRGKQRSRRSSSKETS